jgi:hypothetical protein
MVRRQRQRSVTHVYRGWRMQGACSGCEGLDVRAVLVLLVLVLLLRVRLFTMIDRASVLHHIYGSAALRLDTRRSEKILLILSSAEQQVSKHSLFSCSPANCCRVTYHTLSGRFVSHAARMRRCRASLRRQRGRPLAAFRHGAALAGVSLVYAYEAVRGTEKKQARSPTPV